MFALLLAGIAVPGLEIIGIIPAHTIAWLAFIAFAVVTIAVLWLVIREFLFEM